MTASQKPKLDSEISLRVIITFVVVLVLIVVIASASMYFLTKVLRDRGAANDPPLPLLPEARQSHEPPTPRLQADPMQEMTDLRTEESQELSSYIWVDEAGGIAAIPVERAMAILAESATTAPPETDLEPSEADEAPTAGEPTNDDAHDEGGH